MKRRGDGARIIASIMREVAVRQELKTASLMGIAPQEWVPNLPGWNAKIVWTKKDGTNGE